MFVSPPTRRPKVGDLPHKWGGEEMPPTLHLPTCGGGRTAQRDGWGVTEPTTVPNHRRERFILTRPAGFRTLSRLATECRPCPTPSSTLPRFPRPSPPPRRFTAGPGCG